MMKEQFSRNKKLIIHYYIVAGIAALLFSWSARNEANIDSTIMTILAVYIILFPIVILFTRKYALHVFLFSLAFITGFYSFYTYSAEDHSIWNILYFTFQLYILEMPNVFTPDGSGLLHYPLIAELARWSAALYTISTLFIAMYRMLEMSILHIFYQMAGRHIIIFGYSENSIDLIENLRKKKRRVMLIATHIPNEAIDYLDELKVVVLYNYDNDESIYSKCGMRRAKHVVLFHQKDVDNLDELMNIRYHFKKHSQPNPHLTVHVHLKNLSSRKLFMDLESTSQDEDHNFNVKLINLYELFVDTLFEKYPIYRPNGQKSSVHLLLIGFGPLGQHIALKAITQSKQLKPMITAIDKDMSRIQQQWQRDYGRLTEQASISLYSFDVTSQSIESVIQNQSTPITHIYVCLHEDHLDLWTSLELSRLFPDIPIFLEFSERSIVQKWIDSEVSDARLLYSIGTFEDILTEDKLLYS